VAKRGIQDHEKTMMLADELNIMEPFAVGVLEVFWQWVAKYRPTGDLNGVKPSLMCRAIRYTGNPSELWQALIASRFVDQDGDSFQVHDWSDHADDPSRCGRLSPVKARRLFRIRLAGGEVSRKMRIAIMGRDRKCKVCGSDVDLTIDHIMPVSRGGRTSLENLQVLCRACNSRKRDKVLA
jgi:hypothetical protein